MAPLLFFVAEKQRYQSLKPARCREDGTCQSEKIKMVSDRINMKVRLKQNDGIKNL